MFMVKKFNAIMNICSILKCKKKRWKNVFEAISPIRWLSCLFGLGIIYYPSNHPRVKLSIFYVILTTTAYLIALNYVIVSAFNSNWFKTTEAILFGIVYVNAFLYLINIILMWIWSRRAGNIWKRLTKTDEILEKLRIPLNYKKIYIISLKTIILWCIVSFFMCIVDLMWFMDKVDLLTNFMIMLVLFHPIQANSTIFIGTGFGIIIMKWRIKNINGLLSNIVDRKKKRLWENFNLCSSEARWIIRANNLRYCTSSRITINNILQITRHLHLEWTVLFNENTMIFGLQLAFQLAAAFIIVTGVTFVLYIVLVSPVFGRTIKIHRMIILTIWLVETLTTIFIFNRVIAEILAEWKKTGQIIHELGIICEKNRDRNEIQKFSLQIIQNPLSPTASGLVTLGNSFILRFIGSVTTYVIILVQMYDISK